MTYELPAPTIRTSVSIVSSPSKAFLGVDNKISFSGYPTIFSTQVDRAQIFHETESVAALLFTGSNSILPTQLNAGDVVRNDIPQSMNIFRIMNKVPNVASINWRHSP